jgi:hypothetical protein
VPTEEDNRREERVRAALRVDLGNNTSGVTRDVSASGIFFETDARFAAGRSIAFAIDIDAPGGKMTLSCQGEIVRVEQRDRRVGVAVRIVESMLRPASAVA